MNSNFFTQQIIPGIYAVNKNKLLSKEFDKIQKKDVHNDKIGAELKEFLEQIKRNVENQSERKKNLEDKVKSILFSITIAITAITFSLNYSHFSLDALNLCITSLLLVGVCYFIFSTIRSVQALTPIPFHIVEMEIDASGDSINLDETVDEEQFKNYVRAKLSNDNANLRVANLTYASFTLFRNGIIFFSLYFLGALIQKNLREKSNHIVSSDKVRIRIKDSTDIILPYTLEFNTRLQNFKTGEDSLKTNSRIPGK
jgi:hypothetical protein